MRENMRIKNFPISFYSMVLGLAGITIAFQKAEEFLGVSVRVSYGFLYLALAVFAVITIVYGLKMVLFRGEVAAEWRHPVRLNFLPAFSISLLLFSIAFLDLNLTASRTFWIIGAVLQFLFTIKVLSYWIQSEHLEVTHMNPAWFIPVVGNILVPVAGVTVFSFSREISWFFFSIGAIFWIVLFSILIYRIIFHKPIQSKLLPTFFIMIAPPAVGFISYFKLAGELNDFGRILYFFALFLLFLLVSQLKYLHKSEFYLSWWAYSFPIAALTIASTVMFHLTDGLFYRVAAYVLLALLIGIILFLLGKTGVSVWNRRICVEEA